MALLEVTSSGLTEWLNSEQVISVEVGISSFLILKPQQQRHRKASGRHGTEVLTCIPHSAYLSGCNFQGPGVASTTEDPPGM